MCVYVFGFSNVSTGYSCVYNERMICCLGFWRGGRAAQVLQNGGLRPDCHIRPEIRHHLPWSFFFVFVFFRPYFLLSLVILASFVSFCLRCTHCVLSRHSRTGTKSDHHFVCR